MDWLAIGRVVARRWMIFLPVLASMLWFSVQIRDTGAEFIASAEIVVTAPRGQNALLLSARQGYRSPAILAAIDLNDDSYAAELAEQGFANTFEFDYTSEFPVVLLDVRGASYDAALDAAYAISEEYAQRIDDVQAERDVIGALRQQAEVVAVFRPSSRPAGSRRALAGLIAASLMVAGGLTYVIDQFVLGHREELDPDPGRRRDSEWA